MLILILAISIMAGLAAANALVLIPLSTLQWLEPPSWMLLVAAVGTLAWLIGE